MMAKRKGPPLTRPPEHEFVCAEVREIAQIAETQGWQVAAHDYMRSRNHSAYRLAIDEYRAQLRFLLPLTAESFVLDLRCDWGSVAFNLAMCTASVVAMDDRHARLRFVSARRKQMGAETLHTLCASTFPNLPFTDGAFHAVILLDALGKIGVADESNGKGIQQTILDETRRVLKSDGWLLLGAANRLGFVRSLAGAPQHPRTYWSYRRALQSAGFSKIQFHAPLPSHREPFFILPLDQSNYLNYFVNWMFTAQDYRSKLEERGLGFAFRLAWAMWRIGQHLRMTSLVRYAVPSYLILARN